MRNCRSVADSHPSDLYPGVSHRAKAEQVAQLEDQLRLEERPSGQSKDPALDCAGRFLTALLGLNVHSRGLGQQLSDVDTNVSRELLEIVKFTVSDGGDRDGKTNNGGLSE